MKTEYNKIVYRENWTKQTKKNLPDVLYTVPTSSLNVPIIVPDRSKFREYNT